MGRSCAKEAAAAEAAAAAAAAAEAEEAAAALAADLNKKASVSTTPDSSGPKKRTGPRGMRDGGAVGVVGLVYSDIMELHEGPPQHFERPARHAAVVAKIQKEGLEKRCEAIAARPAEDDELLTCHTQEHIDAVESTFDPCSFETVQVGPIVYSHHHIYAPQLVCFLKPFTAQLKNLVFTHWYRSLCCMGV